MVGVTLFVGVVIANYGENKVSIAAPQVLGVSKLQISFDKNARPRPSKKASN